MRRWTLLSRAERGGVILSGAWTTSTCYKPREIERLLLPKYLVSAYPISTGVRAYGTRRSKTKEVSIRSDGRAMGDRGTTDPTRQAEPPRRTPAEGQHAGSPEYVVVPQS